MTTAAGRTKVAILGGGLGSLAAALELTSTESLRRRYEVTVYQIGWRLGGKGASGRNMAIGSRIEEHGLHIWLGFYENAFRMIRTVYDEWEPTAGCPFAYWTDAFRPQNTVTFMEQTGYGWLPWTITLPATPQTPGDGGAIDSVWSHLIVLLESVRTAVRDSPLRPLLHMEDESITARIRFAMRALFVDVEATGALAAHEFMDTLLDCVRVIPDPPLHVADALDTFRRHSGTALGSRLDTDDHARRLFIQIDLCCTIVRGLIVDRVLNFADFNKLDGLEFREWLEKHGAAPRSTDSGPIRAWYDLAFSYVEGDTSRPCTAAGTALRALLRMAAGYKGAVMWKMQAGMGDTVFTPIYEVLKRRGVRFKFFHRIDRLHVDPATKEIAAIDVGQQVSIIGGGDYDPLVDVRGLRSWPSRPKYGQLAQGDALVASGEDLESHWTRWEDARRYTLRLGDDFDIAILGISLGALAPICEELLAIDGRWRDMIAHTPTVRTQAVQLWLRPNARGLGWLDVHTVLAGYVEPLATWGDMSHLIPREQWSEVQTPGSIAYMCGPLSGEDADPPPSDADYPARAATRVRQAAIDWLMKDAAQLWPRVRADGHLDWQALVAADAAHGSERLDGQYWRANIDPSARYVQTPPHSISYRLESGDSGFPNLYLAGDWVFTGINGGCVEAAVMGGMKASHAICGVPAEIPGDVTKTESPLP